MATAPFIIDLGWIQLLLFVIVGLGPFISVEESVYYMFRKERKKPPLDNSKTSQTNQNKQKKQHTFAKVKVFSLKLDFYIAVC